MVWRAVLWTSLAVVATGIAATAVRWTVDPSAPSTSCISGGGTATEAVLCTGLDAVASMSLWMAIVGIPAVLVAAGVAYVLDRRRHGAR